MESYFDTYWKPVGFLKQPNKGVKTCSVAAQRASKPALGPKYVAGGRNRGLAAMEEVFIMGKIGSLFGTKKNGRNRGLAAWEGWPLRGIPLYII